MDLGLQRYWVRWESSPEAPFEYHGPWWISGTADDVNVYCAAVLARSEDAARSVIASSYDSPEDATRIQWSFVNVRDANWEPFSERFPRKAWMQWPWPVPGNDQ